MTELEVTLVDSYGSLIVDARVSVAPRGGRSVLIPVQRGSFVARMPTGNYTVVVEAAGFRRLSRDLTLEHPRERVRLGLLLGRVGDPDPGEDATLKGRVLGCEGQSQLWVRLSGVFIDEVHQVSVSADSCRFQFRGLPGGEYLSYVVSGHSVRACKAVRVRQENDELVIDLVRNRILEGGSVR